MAISIGGEITASMKPRSAIANGQMIFLKKRASLLSKHVAREFTFFETLPVMTKIAIVGSGAMAIGCSVIAAKNADTEICLWARTAERADEIQSARENTRLLPGIKLPENVSVTADAEIAAADADLLVASVPTAFLDEALRQFQPFLRDRNCPVASVVKGIENGTFRRPSEIIVDALGARDVVALCGPSHAEEFAKRLPASVVAASESDEAAKLVQDLFTTDRFRVYTNDDIVGTELAGALKNVIAIAAGICDGLQYGDNAKAALISRGLAEIQRFGEAFGAKADTFSGLAGIGDLVTTCVSPHGRNRQVGFRLGKGEKLAEILDSMNSVAEGVATTRSVFELAQLNGLDLPITNQVYEVLFNDKSATDATNSLMTRPPKAEAR